jgi:integrase/recombinase XerC
MNVQDTQSVTLELHWLDKFQAFLEDDYRKITRRQLSGKSIKLAVQHVRVFGLWHQAKFSQAFNPATMTNFAMRTYRAWSLNEERVKAATWNSRLWALSILCKWAEREDALEGVEQKDAVQQSTKHRSLTDNEYNYLNQIVQERMARALTVFEYRDRARDYAAVTVMLEAGLRIGEVCDLDKSDIEINERSGWLCVRSGKGEKERKVPLNVLARHALKTWLELRQDENSALFDGKDSQRLTTRSIERIAEDLRIETRIPDLLCHSLRFTFAKRTEKRLGAQGYSRSEIIRTIQRLLGHKRSDTTEIYLRSSMDDLQSAVEGVM